MKYKNLTKSLLLNEDVEQNKLYRDQALSIWNDLVNYLDKDGRLKVSWKNKHNLYSFRLYVELSEVSEDLQDNLEVWFEVGKKGGGKYVKDVPAISIDVFGLTMMNDIYNDVYNSLKDQGKVPEIHIEDRFRKILSNKLPEILEKENKRAFIHEYTHYIDKKYKGAIKNYESAFDSQYFTDPLETNARFQTALSDFESDKMDVLKKDKIQDFRSFVKWFFKEYRKLLELDQLNDKIIKSYTKRLYKYWDNVLPQIFEKE